MLPEPFFMQLALSAKRLELLKEALPAYSARKMAKNQFSCGIGGKIPWNTHLPQITRAFALYDAQSADQVPSTVADAASLGLQLNLWIYVIPHTILKAP